MPKATVHYSIMVHLHIRNSLMLLRALCPMSLIQHATQQWWACLRHTCLRINLTKSLYIASYTYTVFLNLLIWKADIQRSEKEREIFQDRPAIHWLTSHMAATATSGLVKRLHSGLPHAYRTQVLGKSSVAFPYIKNANNGGTVS